jgi:DNA-binding HxlR family transcriptional regulator
MLFSRATDILRFTRLQKKITVNRLIDLCGGSATTIKKDIFELQIDELIDVKVEKKFPFTHWITLTKRGKKLEKAYNFR